MHIIDNEGALSPSSFIPFCSFGEDMESLGTRIKDFDIPVCSSFQAKIKDDQLCYELDLHKLKNNTDIEDQLKSGLFLVLDYNEDRQLIMKNQISKTSEKLKMFSSDKENKAQIHLDTISMINLTINLCTQCGI